MKAYMYNVESGLYEGETFEDDHLIKYVDGLTTTSPPRHDKGQVPVFDRNSQRWSVVPLTEMKERLGYNN
ncbi:MAG: hypothetical protein HXX11_21025 [Desulfuromonadales bacterium]|nr:hypothetical protein [Desulfuromonadales bacterium]